MKIVRILNRFVACEIEPEPNTVVISISRPDDPAPLKEGWEEILRLEFDDIINLKEGGTLFNSHQADDVF